MKKLNRKGFTLVELLAVIIILAIVVGISIPAVLTTTSEAKKKAFQTAADSAADWFDRQYQVALTGLDGTGIATLDANFKEFCNADGSYCTATLADGEIPVSQTTSEQTIMAAAGLKSSNVASMTVHINKNTGRSCVTLVAADKGDYVGAGTTKTTKDNDTIKSSNCQ